MRDRDIRFLGAPLRGSAVARPLRPNARRLGITRMRPPVAAEVIRRLPQSDFSTLVDEAERWSTPARSALRADSTLQTPQAVMLRMGRAVVPARADPGRAAAVASLHRIEISEGLGGMSLPADTPVPDAGATPTRSTTETLIEVRNEPAVSEPMAEGPAALADSTQPARPRATTEQAKPDPRALVIERVESITTSSQDADAQPAASRAFGLGKAARLEPTREAASERARTDEARSSVSAAMVIETPVEETMGPVPERAPVVVTPASVVDRIRDAADSANERVLRVGKIYVQVSRPAASPRTSRAQPAAATATPVAVRPRQRPAFRDPWKAAFKG